MFEYTDANKAYLSLQVSNLQRACDFYKGVFGFEVPFDHRKAGLPEGIGWVELSLPFDGARPGLAEHSGTHSSATPATTRTMPRIPDGTW